MGAWEVIKAAAVLGAFVYRAVQKRKVAKEAVVIPPPPPRGRRK